MGKSTDIDQLPRECDSYFMHIGMVSDDRGMGIRGKWIIGHIYFLVLTFSASFMFLVFSGGLPFIEISYITEMFVLPDHYQYIISIYLK